MAGEKIFIVEDERIVAEDLKRMLERLGYRVVGSVSDGEEAVRQVETSAPDLVLMDVRIQGPEDGVETAERIFTRFGVPVIYLTAYADQVTLERAKGTMPAGYILKPFEERGLQAGIEVALHRCRMDQVLANVEEWPAAVLGNLREAVVAVDARGLVVYMNKSAEALVRHPSEKAFGKPLGDILPGDPAEARASSRFFIERDGRRIPVDGERSPVVDRDGRAIGSAFVLKERKPL